jgi:hypothetical protein
VAARQYRYRLGTHTYACTIQGSPDYRGRPPVSASLVREHTYNKWGAGLLAFATITAAQAQPVPQTITLPPVKVEASSPSCVDVQVEGARSLSFDCLNQELKDAAQQQNETAPTVSAKDVTGSGAPTQVGTFSYTGTSIRMGNAFGHSATPQRPPAPSFTSALVPHVAGAR